MHFHHITTELPMITSEQNTVKQLQRLSAQRQLYATAKKVFGMQVALCGPGAVMAAFFTIAYPACKGYTALWGIILAMADIFWFIPWQKGLRDLAARVQESFDCDVLVLPWNDVKAGKRPDPELIIAQSDKYQVWASKMPPLTDWYSPVVDDLPLHVGRLACQRSNCWWDSQQRRRYAGWVIAVVVLVFGVVFTLSLGKGFTIEDFVLKVAAPLAPVLMLGIRQYSEQVEAATRLDNLKNHAEQLWNEALSGKSEAEITTKARLLQDEILENRRKNPLVFDGIYKWLRRSYELQMNHGAAEFVADAKNRLRVNDDR